MAKATKALDWRAEDWKTDPIIGWHVCEYDANGEWELIVGCLTEPTARLIAAAPAKAALCEELADALEGLWQLVENGELVRDTSRDADGPAFTMQAMTIVVHLKKAEAALAKAGRVPQ